MRLALLVLLGSVGSVAAKPWVWQKTGKYNHDLAAAADGTVATYAGDRLRVFGPDGKLRKEIAGFGLVTSMTYAPDGDLVVVGYSSKAGFVTRLRADGTERWRRDIAVDATYTHHVAVSADRVLVVGRFFGKGTVEKTPIDGEGGMQILYDADGKLLDVKLLPLDMQGELAGACWAGDGFVVSGTDQSKKHRTGFVRGLTKDGVVRWTTDVPGEADGMACRADGSSFAMFSTQGRSPDGNFSSDVTVVEHDKAGKLVRTIAIATPLRDKPLSISASATELVVATSHQTDMNLWSRVTRFGRDGKQLGVEDFKDSMDKDPVWVRAVITPRGVVLAGEVEKTAKVTIHGTSLVGPTLFTIGL